VAGVGVADGGYVGPMLAMQRMGGGKGMFPGNEAETIALYQVMQESLGWNIVHLQTRFPDAIIENRKGKRLVVEFEYLARNFWEHGHDPSGCDLIICWGNNWLDSPLPVWALEDIMVSDDRNLNRLKAKARRSEDACRCLWKRVYALEEKVKCLEHQRQIFQGGFNAAVSLQCKPTGTIGLGYGKTPVGDLCIHNPIDFERLQYFFRLLSRLPGYQAILDWVATADIPSRYQTNQILREVKVNVKEKR